MGGISMKSKIFLLALTATFLGSGGAYSLSCPDLTDWDGKSSIGNWIPNPKKIMLDGLTWYPYHAWILNESKDQPGKFLGHRDDTPLQCVFTTKEGYKISFGCINDGEGNIIDPKNYQFKESKFAKPYHKKGGASGFKFDLREGSKEEKPLEGFPYVNKFPDEAIFLDRKMEESKEF